MSGAWAQAFTMVLDPYNIVVMLGASLFGLFVGAMPGLTATMGVAAKALQIEGDIGAVKADRLEDLVPGEGEATKVMGVLRKVKLVLKAGVV